MLGPAKRLMPYKIKSLNEKEYKIALRSTLLSSAGFLLVELQFIIAEAKSKYPSSLQTADRTS